MTRQAIPDAGLDDRLFFGGTAGSGKTYNAMGRVERLLAKGARVVIPDPLGVWWGLRLRADGKNPSGFDVAIFGGPHGDLPLTEHAGALIGETVAGMKESCILDLSQLGTKAAERRFMLAFLAALYKHTTGEPLHVVFDEADMWSPQRLLDKEGDAAKLLGMMETICRRGRVKGFIPWLISQRPAVISKDVLSQVDGLIAFKLTSSQDRDAIGDWVEGQADKAQWREIWASLPTMERGQGVVWIPARGILETVQFPQKETFDSSRTPKRGEKAQRATELKPLDLSRLKEKLATVEAETKANDPKALRTEIAALKRDLATKPAATIDPTAIEQADQRGYARGWKEGANATKVAFDQKIAALAAVVNDLRMAGQTITPPAAAPAKPYLSNGHARAGQAPRPQIIHDGGASPTVRKILDEIHRANPVALTFEAAAMRAAVSRRSSAYRVYRQQVETSEEVERRLDGRFTSAPGYAADIHPGADPVEAFAARLPPSYAGMLRAIAAARSAMTKEEIAAAANVSPTSSGLTSGIRELIALSLIERDGDAYSIHHDLS